ncbi:peptidylprolyl isomerase [Spirosoma pomorum]
MSKQIIKRLLFASSLSLCTIVKGQVHSIKTNNDIQYIDSTAKVTIDSIYNLLVAGHDFRDLAFKYSQDASSYKQGGELAFTTMKEYVSEYRNAILGLTLNGISKPFRTKFGYHIAQLLSKKDSIYRTKHILIRVVKPRRYHSVVSNSSTVDGLNSITYLNSSSNYNSFYKKCILVNGIPILSSQKVDDHALYNAKDIVAFMTSILQPKILHKLKENKLKIVIKAEAEVTTDIPEHKDLYKFYKNTNWNNLRGLGATHEWPVSSCAEENLLCRFYDLHKGYDILVHEFAHAIHQLGINDTDKQFDRRLKNIWKQAKKERLWNNTYAITNREEYFACGVQSWFHVNGESNPEDEMDNLGNTRSKLKEYDPRLYELLKEYFPMSDLYVSCNCGD